MSTTAVVSRPALPRSLPLTVASTWPWIAAALISVLTWPVSSLDPNLLPEAWPVGLHLAAVEGLRFGHDIVFTYGPLGFLAFPVLVTTATGLASVAYAVIVHTALAVVVIRAGRGSFGRWPAVAAAAVACSLPLPLADVPVVLVFAGCAWAVQRETAGRSLLLVPAGGLVAAFELMVKLNDGMLCLALAAVAAWSIGPRGLRAEAILAASFAASVAGLWLVTGNRLGDLPSWFRLCAHIVSGYGGGMSLDHGALAELPAAEVILLAFVALILCRARMVGRRRGLSLCVLAAIFVYGFFKEGFVRYDHSHAPIFFAAVAVAAMVAGWRPRLLGAGALSLASFALSQVAGRSGAVLSLLVLAAAAVAVKAIQPRPELRRLLFLLVTVGFAALFVQQFIGLPADTETVWLAAALLVVTLGWASRRAQLFAIAAMAASLLALALSPDDLLPDVLPLHPSVATKAFHQTRTLLSADRRSEEMRKLKAATRARHPLAASTVASLRGRSVDVEVDGATIAWAYSLDWRPEPVIESYSAYDTTLDRYAAAWVAKRGPARILHSWASIDRQNPVWQGPALVLAEICNYRETLRGRLSLLVRSPARCGRPRLIRSVVARPDAWVAVPHAGSRDIVYATMDVRQSPFEAIRSLLYKPTSLAIDVSAPEARHRFISGTANDPHVMHLPRVDDLPSPAHGVAIDAFRIAGASGSIHVRFYALPVLR